MLNQLARPLKGQTQTASVPPWLAITRPLRPTPTARPRSSPASAAALRAYGLGMMCRGVETGSSGQLAAALACTGVPPPSDKGFASIRGSTWGGGLGGDQGGTGVLRSPQWHRCFCARLSGTGVFRPITPPAMQHCRRLAVPARRCCHHHASSRRLSHHRTDPSARAITCAMATPQAPGDAHGTLSGGAAAGSVVAPSAAAGDAKQLLNRAWTAAADLYLRCGRVRAPEGT